MSRYAVDASQVSAASSAVASSIPTLSGEVDAMTRHLVDLQNSWQGQASTSFQALVAQWRTTQARVQEDLADINRALASAGVAYDGTESEAVRLFTR